MQSTIATQRRAAASLAAWFVFTGCAASRPAYSPGQLTPEQIAICRDAERAYHTNAKDYPLLRERIIKDPVMTAWLVRVFVRDLITVREGRPLGEDEELFKAAARIENPVEARAIAEIRQLGGLSVPTLVGDLLLHPQPQPRELGIELLSMVGEPAVPALQEVARTGEVRPRRSAARALGRIGVDGEVLATLRVLVSDSDFTVRADAVRSITGGGEPARALLLERLLQDPDAYVRRVAAQALGNFPGRKTALALIDFVERCRREKDESGEIAAQKTLQRLAGVRSMREPSAWRQHPWLETAFAPTGPASTKVESK